MFRELEVPFLNQSADILHRAGKLCIHHACGHVLHLLKDFGTTRIDGFDGPAAPPVGNTTVAQARGGLGESIVIMPFTEEYAMKSGDPTQCADHPQYVRRGGFTRQFRGGCCRAAGRSSRIVVAGGGQSKEAFTHVRLTNSERRLVMKKYRAGAVGLSRGRGLVHALATHPDVEITALCDLDQGTLAHQAEVFGVPDKQLYTQYHDFVNAPMDIVMVATPIGYHAEQTIKAMETGKHVLCEQTAAYTVEDCERHRQHGQAHRQAT